MEDFFFCSKPSHDVAAVAIWETVREVGVGRYPDGVRTVRRVASPRL